MAFTKSEAGKGDDDRTSDWKAYWANYDNIFKKPKPAEKNTESDAKDLQKQSEVP
jgi:protein-disulfide isomerase